MNATLAKLQTINRRWIYLAIWLACTIPFIYKISLPVYVSPETRAIYDAVEKTQPGKVVLIDSAWEAGSQGENRGQTEAIIEHLLMRRIPFVVISIEITPLGPNFADQVINKLVAEKYPDRKYGTDWVNLGYTKGGWQAIQQVAKGFRYQYKKDTRGYSLDDAANLPLMQRVKSIDDVSLVVSITYSPLEDWIPFVHEIYGTPIAFGAAGIQSTTFYRYILSKQLVGMFVGVRGAAEYDALLHPEDIANRTNLGTRLIVPQAFGHMVIIFAVALGNIGYFAARKRTGGQA